LTVFFPYIIICVSRQVIRLILALKKARLLGSFLDILGSAISNLAFLLALELMVQGSQMLPQ
jgi:hypothetical protein